jgi:hypothetical protein
MMFKKIGLKCRQHQVYLHSTAIGIVRGEDYGAERLRGAERVIGRYAAASNPHFEQVITERTPNREIRELFKRNVTGLEFFPIDGTVHGNPGGSKLLDKQLRVFRFALQAGVSLSKIGPPTVTSVLGEMIHREEQDAQRESGQEPLCEGPLGGVSSGG